MRRIYLYKHRYCSPKGPTRQDLIDILYIFYIDHCVFYHPVVRAYRRVAVSAIHVYIYIRTITEIRSLLIRNIILCVYETRNSRLKKSFH